LSPKEGYTFYATAVNLHPRYPRCMYEGDLYFENVLTEKAEEDGSTYIESAWLLFVALPVLLL